MDDQTTDESVRINSRIYVSESFCVSPQGDEAELSQKIASLKWHRRELQVSVVELVCVYVCVCMCVCVCVLCSYVILDLPALWHPS